LHKQFEVGHAALFSEKRHPGHPAISTAQRDYPYLPYRQYHLLSGLHDPEQLSGKF
jgi:hypothetical protein